MHLDLSLMPPLAAVLPAYAVTLILFAISVALTAASYFLFKPGKPRLPTGRAQPTYAERGTYVPRILGTQRIAPLVGWLGASSQSQRPGEQAASQQGWHILCVGPAAVLHQILEGGKVIFPKPNTTETKITPATHPSGTKITLKSGKGSFYIYWGEADQPVNTILQAACGMGSRWPYLCYILWDRRQLQVINSWPVIEYVVTVKSLSETYLEDSPAWLEGDGNDTNDGVNPAHAMVEIATEPYPHGVGMSVENLNLPKFEELGVLMETEGIPTNLRTLEGREAAESISNILADCSLMLTQTGSVLTPTAIRAPTEGETFPSLTSSVLLPPAESEKASSIGPRHRASGIQYTFSDRRLKFKDNVISFRDDAEALQQGAPRLQTTILETVISRKVANAVSSRRAVEDLATPIAVKLQAIRGVRLLSAGQRVRLPNDRVIRLFSVERNADSPSCVLEGVEDVYSPIDPNYPEDDTPVSTLDEVPEQDVVFELLELPYALCINKQITMMFARQRANSSVDGARIYLSTAARIIGLEVPLPAPSDATFGYRHSYATLAEDVSFGPAISESGPLIHMYSSNVDASDINDLSGEDYVVDWRKGTNIAVIGDEWCFFRKLTHTTGNYYRLDGLIRGRWTTDRVSHTSGERVWIFPVDEINQINKNFFGKKNSIWYFSQPYVGSDLVEASTIDDNYIPEVLGTSMRPLPPVNFRSDDGKWIRWNTWASGASVNFKWSNRSRLANGFTAGTQLAGEVHSSDAVYMDGFLVIKLVRISDNSLRDTIKVLSGTAYAYSNSKLVSKFQGSEPDSFEVQYYQQIGDYTSPVKTITVTRR